MDPDFGTNIHRYIFELNTSVLEAQVEREITQAITKYEPRVSLVSVSSDRPDPKTLSVNVQVKVFDQFLTLGLNYK
jgi:phage baseplate assembly protein W